ncbi:RNA polymerase III subunit RPC82 helix-turn-helix domain-containing protein [Entophlyctis helioformis]|nr:RNA polymerase III subunit RPC82 helix-turn-helix domain-containing protein [Entophlyctis helioformis]
MSQVQQGLCAEILKEHFGSTAQRVGMSLLTHGRSTLHAIVQSTKLPMKQVRDVLFILIQHHAVTYAESTEGIRVVVYYVANGPEIMLRDRFPSYILKAKSHFGDAGEFIVRTALEEGVLNPSKMLTNSLDFATSELSDAMDKLIRGNFLKIQTPQDTITLKDRHIQEETEAYMVAGKGAPLSATERNKILKGIKAQRSQFDDTVETGSKRKLVMDFEEAEKLKIIIELASRRVNATAGRIIKAMCDDMLPQMRSCKETLSPPIRRDMIGVLTRGEHLSVHGQTGNALMEYIETLAAEPVKILTSVDGPQYAINLRGCINTLKAQLIESIIHEKFGAVCCRIWRLLYMRNKLDEKQIGKLAMVNNKIASESLYAMFKAGFVFLQDVPKTLDHSASRTFFLWYVSAERTSELLLANAYRTMHRLKLRRIKELGDRSLLIEKTKRSDVLSGEAKLTESDQQKLDHLHAVLKRLSVSEWRVDNMILLLRDCH